MRHPLISLDKRVSFLLGEQLLLGSQLRTSGTSHPLRQRATTELLQSSSDFGPGLPFIGRIAVAVRS